MVTRRQDSGDCIESHFRCIRRAYVVRNKSVSAEPSCAMQDAPQSEAVSGSQSLTRCTKQILPFLLGVQFAAPVSVTAQSKLVHWKLLDRPEVQYSLNSRQLMIVIPSTSIACRASLTESELRATFLTESKNLEACEFTMRSVPQSESRRRSVDDDGC